MLDFTASPETAHIVIRVRRYADSAPPFAAVYDAAGEPCNFPPSPLPMRCSGQIATANIYLNDGLPPGADLEARRQRLVLHELGHALGLTRHAATTDVDALTARYGW
jgi:hypothetical protein